MRVNVVCRNLKEDRVLPRFSRYLAEGLGWTVSAVPEPGFDAYYLSGYFEAQLIKDWPDVPVGAYFTHREEEPPGNQKAKLFDSVARRVDLRVATAGMYARVLEPYGLTAQIHPPVERERFVIPNPSQGAETLRGREIRAGFSGYTYQNGRKGEDLAQGLVASALGQKVSWMASGRGWPVPTKKYTWKAMPGFYQALDVLVCTALVEGVPMPPLEALACGVSVVVPRGVGLLDELPETLGIHRYDRGDAADLHRAFAEALKARPAVEREALRAVTEPYSREAWCAGHAEALERISACRSESGANERKGDPAEQIGVDGGVAMSGGKQQKPSQGTEALRGEEAGWVAVEAEVRPEPVEHGTKSKRGIYCVAFGDPARESALRMMTSAKRHMPEIPIALCAAKKIGPEDVLIVEPDSDIGGRRNKLRAYELAPAEWQTVLYLDADTEVVGDIRFYFELIEDGWEFVICKDPHLMDTMHAFQRRNNSVELRDTERQIYTLHTLQYNGGVWAFTRSGRVQAFFARWLAEWERYAGRDQGALIRAMYTDPLKVYLLGNEWNTFPKYTKGIQTAGLMHYPGDARRWEGMISGRIDSPAAWEAVKRFEGSRKGRRH